MGIQSTDYGTHIKRVHSTGAFFMETDDFPIFSLSWKHRIPDGFAVVLFDGHSDLNFACRLSPAVTFALRFSGVLRGFPVMILFFE